MILTVTQANLPEIAEELAAKDKGLRMIHERYGAPPLWSRPTGFPTLVKIILEQQVSLSSAEATYQRLRNMLKEQDLKFQPKGLLQLSDQELRACALSRQKSRYCRLLAEAIESKQLNLSKLAKLPDEEASEMLQQVKGIGQWTANIYLMMALGRADIWPKGDIALAEALKQIRKRPERPGHETQLRMANRWRPYRSVAAKMLWHFYLSEKAAKAQKARKKS